MLSCLQFFKSACNFHIVYILISMASRFNSAEDICEGGNCEAITDVTYYVKEKKKLCKDCASKKGCIIKTRKSRPDLYCEKHDKDIDLYCKTHGVACCCLCAMIDHNEKPCVRQSIEDAIRENRAILKGLKKKAIDKLQLCRLKGGRIRECREDADKHIQAIKTAVDLVIEEVIIMDQDREREDAAKIDVEIDEKNEKLREQIQKLNEQIQQNNEEREKRHELNHLNAEKRRQPMDNKQRSLHADIQNIAEETERKIGELEKSWQDETKTTENSIQTLDTVLEDDQNVVKDGHRVIISVADELDKPLDEGGVKHITRTVSGVRFVKGAGREKYNGRIDGYDGEWKLIDTINVTDKITFPTIVGYIGECNVIITDLQEGSEHTHMLDLNTKHTQRVITGSDTSWVTSCASLNDDKVVCGKLREGCTGDSLTGCISVYDKQWRLINDVTIPRNTTDDVAWVNVAADQDGMIIAAELAEFAQAGQSESPKKSLAISISVGYKVARSALLGRYNTKKNPSKSVLKGSKIYIINPADGKIMNTISCKQDILMLGVLSLGHIIAHCTDADEENPVVAIIDREGVQRTITHSDVILNVCIDPMTDDLYVVTSDAEHKKCVIDQVMSGGDMKKRRVASFPLSTTVTEKDERMAHLISSQVLMTSSGKVIACDEDSILIYKKMFSF